MPQPISNLADLLRAMHPTLHEGVYVFVSVTPEREVSMLQPIATFREAEGVTLILEEKHAVAARLPILFRSAWITLTVHSDLQAVGLTAAVATTLSQANISCNVVAAAFHDHLFVPFESAQAALAVLQKLQHRASESAAPSAIPPSALTNQ